MVRSQFWRLSTRSIFRCLLAYVDSTQRLHCVWLTNRQTRIINVKSEFPSNVITYIRLGKLSVMAKVAERIMKIWDMRLDTNEKVLMLFSVNGSKKFCGIAAMSGPWDPNVPVDGWEVNPAAKSPCVG